VAAAAAVAAVEGISAIVNRCEDRTVNVDVQMCEVDIRCFGSAAEAAVSDLCITSFSCQVASSHASAAHHSSSVDPNLVFPRSSIRAIRGYPTARG
jgi:hypothetical protein